MRGHSLHAGISSGVHGLGDSPLFVGDGVVVNEGAHQPLAELVVVDIHAHTHHVV